MATITENMNKLESHNFTEESFGRRAPSYSVLWRSSIKNRTVQYACYPIKLKNTTKQFVSCCIIMPDGIHFNIQNVDEKKYIFDQNCKFESADSLKDFIKKMKNVEYDNTKTLSVDGIVLVRMIYYPPLVLHRIRVSPVVQVPRQVLRIIERQVYSLPNLQPAQ